jgi:hypothetical protein
MLYGDGMAALLFAVVSGRFAFASRDEDGGYDDKEDTGEDANSGRGQHGG